MPDDDLDQQPAVVVAVTPRAYRERAVVSALAGVVLIVLGVTGHWITSEGGLLWGLFAIGYGAWCAVRARRQVTTTVLRVDRSGLHSGDGLLERDWAGVVMVWVGSSTGLRLPFVPAPALSVFTLGGVEFADRAGVTRKPLHVVRVGAWRQAELCARLRRIVEPYGIDVVDGRTVSRRAAAALS